MGTWKVDVCAWLATIDNVGQTEIDLFRHAKIRGKALKKMTKEEMRDYFPQLAIGDVLEILDERDNVLDSQQLSSTANISEGPQLPPSADRPTIDLNDLRPSVTTEQNTMRPVQCTSQEHRFEPDMFVQPKSTTEDREQPMIQPSKIAPSESEIALHPPKDSIMKPVNPLTKPLMENPCETPQKATSTEVPMDTPLKKLLEQDSTETQCQKPSNENHNETHPKASSTQNPKENAPTDKLQKGTEESPAAYVSQEATPKALLTKDSQETPLKTASTKDPQETPLKALMTEDPQESLVKVVSTQDSQETHQEESMEHDLWETPLKEIATEEPVKELTGKDAKEFQVTCAELNVHQRNLDQSLSPDDTAEKDQEMELKHVDHSPLSVDEPVTNESTMGVSKCRKFCTEIDLKTYKQDSILSCREGIEDGMIVHKFVDAGRIVTKREIVSFVREVVAFLCACLNERYSGTIHFGINRMAASSNELDGLIKGVKLLPESLKGLEVEYKKSLRKCFDADQTDIIFRCIR